MLLLVASYVVVGCVVCCCWLRRMDQFKISGLMRGLIWIGGWRFGKCWRNANVGCSVIGMVRGV